MLDFGLPQRHPMMVAGHKLWPCFSRPEYKWFAAINGKPYYFKTMNEASLIIKDLVSNEDPENLCD